MKLNFLILLILLAANISAKDTAFISSVSWVGMSMDYREYGQDGQILDSEESSYIDLAGVEMSFGYDFVNNISSSSGVEFNLMILGGETEYIGSLRNADDGYGSYISTTQNIVIDTDISYKGSENLKNNFEFIYGIGIGYRWWERALSSSQIEVYSWYSIRPMVGLDYTIKDKFNLGLLIEYQYGFETVMSVSEPALNHNFTLGGADILEVSFPISYVLKNNIEFFLEAIFQKQMIIESDRLYSSDGSQYYYEPESTAFNSYLKLGIEYKF